MHAERTGSGTPIVLVHGLGSNLRTWDPIVPILAAHHEVIAVDLPGFGRSAPLDGDVTVASLADAVASFLTANGLENAALVGSSMGARIVLELASRGRAGVTIALDPVGYWTPRQRTFFAASVTASVWLIRAMRRALPFLSAHAVTRTVLLPQFSARPWRLAPDLVRTELLGFTTAASLDEALHSLIRATGPASRPAGMQGGRVVLGWGRGDKVTLPSQARRATAAFPEATLHWFEASGHFPHWDRPDETAELIGTSARATSTDAT